MADIRKLAAIDIVFLGFKVVVAEYACGVLLSSALGIFILFRSHTVGQAILGAYFLCLGINYVPMFAHALSIGDKERARAELGTELGEKRTAMARYRRLSLLLLRRRSFRLWRLLDWQIAANAILVRMALSSKLKCNRANASCGDCT